MNKKDLVVLFLSISILINIWTLPYLYSLLNQESDEEQEVVDIKEEKELPQPKVYINEPDIQSYDLELGNFEYKSYYIEKNETIQNGNLTFRYLTWDIDIDWIGRIVVKNHESNHTLAYIYDLRNGSVVGLKGFKLEILSSFEMNITIKFSPYYKTDYLGCGKFYLDSYDKSFHFKGNETIIWKNFSYKNDSAIIEVYTDEESYMAWIPDSTRINLGFICIEIESQYRVLFSYQNCKHQLREQDKVLLG